MKFSSIAAALTLLAPAVLAHGDHGHGKPDGPGKPGKPGKPSPPKPLINSKKMQADIKTKE